MYTELRRKRVTGERRATERRRFVVVRRRAVVVALFLRFRAIVTTLLRRVVVVFGAERRRFFVPPRFLRFAANIFSVARFCAAVRPFFRFLLGGFTMNKVPMYRAPV